MNTIARIFFFWRTYDKQEIDLVEQDGEAIRAFEFKWGAKRPPIPTAFASAYHSASYEVISRDNYETFC